MFALRLNAPCRPYLPCPRLRPAPDHLSSLDLALPVLHAAAAAILEAILSKNSIACREYFGRAWTLAEREFRSYIQGVLFFTCPD